MISNKINELENKIKGLDAISGFKKSIAEHNKISKDLLQYKLEIDNLEKTVQSISNDLLAQNSSTIISDETYIKYMDELKSLTNIFESLDVSEQVSVYQQAIEKINLCDSYLKSKKIEIEYVN